MDWVQRKHLCWRYTVWSIPFLQTQPGQILILRTRLSGTSIHYIPRNTDVRLRIAWLSGKDQLQRRTRTPHTLLTHALSISQPTSEIDKASRLGSMKHALDINEVPVKAYKSYPHQRELPKDVCNHLDAILFSAE